MQIPSWAMRAVKAAWQDLCAFHPPAAFLVIGLFCAGFLYTWGSSYVAAAMIACTLLVSYAARRLGGWGQLILGVVFSLFIIGVTLSALVIIFFISGDFSPNGRENYGRIRQEFFPHEIPETAYDVQVWSHVGFYGGEGYYLSYRDAKENIRPYDDLGRARSELRSRHAYINEEIRVPHIIVDERTPEPRFAGLPLWQRLFVGYVPHPAERGVLRERFVFYAWDLESHKQAKIIGVSEDGTRIIFYAVGK